MNSRLLNLLSEMHDYLFELDNKYIDKHLKLEYDPKSSEQSPTQIVFYLTRSLHDTPHRLFLFRNAILNGVKIEQINSKCLFMGADEDKNVMVCHEKYILDSSEQLLKILENAVQYLSDKGLSKNHFRKKVEVIKKPEEINKPSETKMFQPAPTTAPTFKPRFTPKLAGMVSGNS